MLEQDLTRGQDPCLMRAFSMLRFAVLALLVVIMFGSFILLALLEDRPYGIQLSSILGYTASVALYTFSPNRNNMQPFLLSCPVVRNELPTLIRRHLGFVATLFLIQTTALQIRPKLPAYFTTPSSKNASPFALTLGGVCVCLAIVQTLSNRSLLERAHLSPQAKSM